jgi:hypothetical protein
MIAGRNCLLWAEQRIEVLGSENLLFVLCVEVALVRLAAICIRSHLPPSSPTQLMNCDINSAALPEAIKKSHN